MTDGVNMSIVDGIKALYPELNWDRLEEIDRAVNWELWHGPLPSDYWTVAEPLEHYVWEGYDKAVNDLIEFMQDIPSELFYDNDSGVVTEHNPEDDESNWEEDADENWHWIGGEEWQRINTYQELTHKEVYNHVF